VDSRRSYVLVPVLTIPPPKAMYSPSDMYHNMNVNSGQLLPEWNTSDTVKWLKDWGETIINPLSNLSPNNYKGNSINKVTRPLMCVIFLISFKFPTRSEQVEHCFLSRTLYRASYQSYCPNISCKMAGLVETWSNIEVHSVIRLLRLKGTSPAKIHCQLTEVYGANAMSRTYVWIWCTAFDNSRTDIQDEQ
jgi:hypothetical protein